MSRSSLSTEVIGSKSCIGNYLFCYLVISLSWFYLSKVKVIPRSRSYQAQIVISISKWEVGLWLKGILLFFLWTTQLIDISNGISTIFTWKIWDTKGKKQLIKLLILHTWILNRLQMASLKIDIVILLGGFNIANYLGKIMVAKRVKNLMSCRYACVVQTIRIVLLSLVSRRKQ